MSYEYKFLNAEMPAREEVLEKTPNEISKELFRKLEAAGVETFLERFAGQQPMCRFGLMGACCQRCLWGPCRIDPLNPKRQRGICGADLDLVVAGNLLRSLAAGCAAHGTHALQVVETILSCTAGEDMPFSLKGEERVRELARRFAVEEGDLHKQARTLAGILLGSIKGGNNGILQVIEHYAPQEQLDRWKELGILPRSAMEEVFEALHLTTLGSCSDWKQLLKQEMRTALAYCYGALFPACLGQEMLFGIPETFSVPVEVNYGVLGKNTVNVLIHGHSPVLAECLVEAAKSLELQGLAYEAGAEKILLAGACCTGNALLSRHGVPPVANILALELVLATGAVDALVLDMQCAIPGLEHVARCFGVEIITTYDGNRFPRDRHIPFSPREARSQAREICLLAMENFKKRRDKDIFIPPGKTRALAGWGVESFFRAFGGVEKLGQYLAEGKIKGLVSIGGCNSPKLPYEYEHVTLAKELIRYGALVFTTGCASYALLNAGLASPEAADLAPGGLKEVCLKHGLAPVIPLGACTDNSRLVQIYSRVAAAAKKKTSQMPYCHSGPAPGSEKNIGQGLTFLLHGVSVHQGFPGGIPVPVHRPVENRRYHDELKLEMSNVARFFAEGAFKKLGARVYGEPYPNMAAKTIQMHLHRQRLALGWGG